MPSDEGVSLLRDMVSSAGGARADSSSGAWTPSTVVIDGCRCSATFSVLAHESEALAVVAALVWGLRQRDEAAEFIVHTDYAVAREAALATPVSRRTLSHSGRPTRGY